METTFQNALNLYEQKDYSAAADVAMKLFEGDYENKCELLVLVAKCCLDSRNVNSISKATDMLKDACSFATCIEQVWDAEESFYPAFYNWRLSQYALKNAAFVANPTLDTLTAYFKLKQTLIRSEMLVMGALQLNCKMVDAFCASEGITPQEYSKNYFTPKVPVDTTASKRAELEASAAEVVFGLAKVQLGECTDVNVEFFKKTSLEVSTKLILAMALSEAAAQDKKITSEEKCKYLLLDANIVSFLLEAKMYPHGRYASIYTVEDERAKYADRVKKNYEKISQINPDFDAPDVPSVGYIPFVDINTPTTTKSSGGCYVATAVYGSYDCPQVWTLRRFRDNTLASTWYGRAFIRTYYAISPTLVKWFGHTAWFKNMWRGKLDKMVNSLQKQGVESTPYQDKNW